MSKAPELLPCPFCGGEANMNRPIERVPNIQVACLNCRAGFYRTLTNDTEMTELWNTRVYPPEITEKLHRLEITDMFVGAVLGLAGITQADGDIDPGVVADKMLNDHLCRLYDQIMHLPCVVPVQLMTRNDIQIYGWGYVTARKAAADLVAEIKEGKEGE